MKTEQIMNLIRENQIFKIGDEVLVYEKVPVVGLEMKKKQIITDIACTLYKNSGKVECTYQLDGSYQYVPLVRVQENVALKVPVIPGSKPYGGLK